MGCDIGGHTSLAIILLSFTGLSDIMLDSLPLRLPWHVRLAMVEF